MTYAVEQACAVGADQWIKETTQKALARLLSDTLTEADRAGMLGDYLPRIEKAIVSMPSSWFRTNEFKSFLKETLDDTLPAMY